jgi:hypothetical protein
MPHNTKTVAACYSKKIICPSNAVVQRQTTEKTMYAKEGIVAPLGPEATSAHNLYNRGMPKVIDTKYFIPCVFTSCPGSWLLFNERIVVFVISPWDQSYRPYFQKPRWWTPPVWWSSCASLKWAIEILRPQCLFSAGSKNDTVLISFVNLSLCFGNLGTSSVDRLTFQFEAQTILTSSLDASELVKGKQPAVAQVRNNFPACYPPWCFGKFRHVSSQQHRLICLEGYLLSRPCWLSHDVSGFSKVGSISFGFAGLRTALK